MTGKSDWQGRVGSEWALRADALDRLLGPVGEAGIDMLGDIAGRSVLDVGCGSGASSLKLADQGAKVTGIDISKELLAVAHKRNIGEATSFMLLDAATEQPNTKFDAMYSRFGVMFFDEPARALNNLRQTLQDGACAAFVTWNDRERNIWASLPSRCVSDIVTPRTASGGPGPFAWSDPDFFSNILHQAGWHNISWQMVERDAVMEAGDANDPLERAAEFALRIGPLASNLRGAEPDLRQKIRQRLIGALSPFLHAGSVSVPTSAWVIQAQA